MKKTLNMFLLIFLVFSCNKEFIKKPENLISESEMVDILFDIAIVKAKNSAKKSTVEKNIPVEDYIYKKYNIDSVILSQNTIYYSSKPEKHIEIYEKLEKRLSDLKKEYESEEDSIKENLKLKRIKKPKPKKANSD